MAETSEKSTRRPYAYYARARAHASKKRDTIGTVTTETGKDRSRSSFCPHLFLISHVLRGGLAVIIVGVRISCGKGKGNGRIAESRRQRALKSTRLIIALHNVARSRIRDNSAPAEGRRGRANLPAPLPVPSPLMQPWCFRRKCLGTSEITRGDYLQLRGHYRQISRLNLLESGTEFLYSGRTALTWHDRCATFLTFGTLLDH